MITEELILKHGYKSCRVPIGTNADKAWFKILYNSEGKRTYQICIYYYIYTKHFSFSSEVCFEYPNDKTGWFTFRANTIEEIEEFFANLFECTGALLYNDYTI